MTPAAEDRVVSLLEEILAELRQRNAPPPALIDADEFARQLGVNVRTLRRMRHEGGVPKPIEIGNVIRWRRADVERFLQGKKP